MMHCDLEADGLVHDATRVWVLVSYDDRLNRWQVSYDYQEAQQKPVAEWTPGHATIYKTHTEHLELLRQHATNFHNWFGYDGLVLRKFVPDFEPKDVHDTLILSQLFRPDRVKHGLKSWGSDLEIAKPKYTDWRGGLTAEMVRRCFEDVRITHAVYNDLRLTAKGWDWSKSVRLEYKIADIIGRQVQHGCYFDIDRAYYLAEWLWDRVHKLGQSIESKMPYIVQRGVNFNPFKINGTLKSTANSEDSGEYCRVSFVAPNINSPQQWKSFLLANGWQPTKHTEKGSPQLTDDSYHTINGELGEQIAERAWLKHRAQMLFNSGGKGLINMVRDDGRVEAGALTNGTNTGRFKHMGVVNIPKPKDPLLPLQIRELFCAPADRLLMGIDADGLEARMMCHYLVDYDGGEEYADIVLNGDIHAHNAKIFGTDRDGAKSPYYCIMYGGQPAKFAETLGTDDINHATQLWLKFWEESKPLKLFKDAITAQWKRNGGFIVGIDGRKIAIRSPHSIVNAAFQSTGSIVVKWATALMDHWCREHNLQAQQVLHFHDEFTYELPPEEQDIVAELAKKAFVQAGTDLQIKIPVTGSPKFGKNWREIH